MGNGSVHRKGLIRACEKGTEGEIWLLLEPGRAIVLVHRVCFPLIFFILLEPENSVARCVWQGAGMEGERSPSYDQVPSAWINVSLARIINFFKPGGTKVQKSYKISSMCVSSGKHLAKGLVCEQIQKGLTVFTGTGRLHTYNEDMDFSIPAESLCSDLGFCLRRTTLINSRLPGTR